MEGSGQVALTADIPPIQYSKCLEGSEWVIKDAWSVESSKLVNLVDDTCFNISKKFKPAGS
eukprot:4012108-Alexandrium_andersonii.AAC.1